MKYSIQPYSIQELGKRENQEDSIFPSCGQSVAGDRLFILCDGMGGHEHGEVASATVCEVISQFILSRWHTPEPLGDDLLLQAIDAAYDALDTKDDSAEKKMGTTLTVLCLHAAGATVAHIGDSRVYQIRPGEGVTFCTRDHSLVNDLIKIGEITEEEAKTHPQKNVITRAMQPHQSNRAKADIVHLVDIRPGDYFFLCSDGMLEQTTDDNLVNILSMQGASNKEKVEMLRKVTEDNNDNHTAHLIYINEVKGRMDGEEGKKSEAEGANASSPKSQESPLDLPWRDKSEFTPTSVTVGISKRHKSRGIIMCLLVAVLLVAVGVVAYTVGFANGQAEVKKENITKPQSHKVKKESKKKSEVRKESTRKDSVRKNTKINNDVKPEVAPIKEEKKKPEGARSKIIEKIKEKENEKIKEVRL